MIKEGIVSLWLGKSTSSLELENYLKITYTEDGDLIQSKFGKDFLIQRYDEDFREAKFLDDPTINLNNLLSDFSYAEEIVPKFIDMCEKLTELINAVIMLYDFEYDRSVKEAGDQLSRFKFIGSIQYE